MTMDGEKDIKVYSYRYVVLCIFCLNSVLNNMLVYQFTSVTEQTSYFYDIDPGAVDWTALVFALINIVLFLPCCWFFDKKGLRWAILANAFFTFLGNGIKCFSITPERFYLLLLGQTICSIGQVFLYPTPSRLAADWFPAADVSTASSVAVLAGQVGSALSFLVTTWYTDDVRDKTILRNNFLDLQYGIFGVSTALLILTAIGMRNQPDLPPSVAAACRRKEESELQKNYIASVRRFLKNKNFILHWFSYGLNVAAFFSLGTIFTQVLSTVFTVKVEDSGWMGFYTASIGIPFTLMSGFYLDKTRHYKAMSVLLYVVSLLSCVLFTVMNRLVSNFKWLYIPSTLIGIAFTCYMSAGYELGTEITYPESESTMAGLLYAFVQVFGLVSLPIAQKCSQFFPNYVDIVLMTAYSGMVLVGFILTVFIRPDYRRQAAEKHNVKENTN